MEKQPIYTFIDFKGIKSWTDNEIDYQTIYAKNQWRTVINRKQGIIISRSKIGESPSIEVIK
jgi:hypothetical protein